MKARLLHFQDTLQLLLCNGKIQTLSVYDAYLFLSNYDDPNLYVGPGRWDYENVTMESYRGSTIAVVNDNSALIVADPNWFRTILESRIKNLATAQEYASLHGKKSAIVRRFCLANRIPGSFCIGQTWLIPKDAPYPPDERFR